MTNDATFRARIGAVNIPQTTSIIGETDDDGADNLPEILSQNIDRFPGVVDPRIGIGPWWERFRWCNTTLREGCYRITYRPAGTPWWSNYFAGTVRIEKIRQGYRISGDLYRRSFFIRVPWRDPLRPIAETDFTDETDGGSGTIPIYRRRDYSSYLEGTGAQLSSFTAKGQKCKFTLNFDEWNYTHPASGFAGTFPNSANRSVRYVLSSTGVADSYSGTAYDGATELGTVSMSWVSPFFRRANLEMRRLTGAEHPPEVGSENLETIFKTVGWHLSVDEIDTAMAKPASLSTQSATNCWSTTNLHRLMEAVPGYDPSVLDTQWKAYLLAVPAQLGCSRGVMFDSSGDRNNIKREGAATFSHDGFPQSHSSNFGVAEDELMREHPRAFLRSAAHEVGHTFNQIHQFFEGGSDNSVMTVTPSVADVLAANGQTFPNDINLGFNATVRRHMIHLPDPAVRPGAMGFFGSAINAPEADSVAYIDELRVDVKPATDSIRLGEPLQLSWTVTNDSDTAIPLPAEIGCEDLTARVNVTSPNGTTTFNRPVNISVCSTNPVEELAVGDSRTGETTLFYGTDGFAFDHPGRHQVEVNLLWNVAGAHLMTTGTADVWVAYPLTDNDNKVASLLLDPCVGEAVALGTTEAAPGSAERIAEAIKTQTGHPANEQLRKLGVAPKKRAPRKKTTAKKTTRKKKS